MADHTVKSPTLRSRQTPSRPSTQHKATANEPVTGPQLRRRGAASPRRSPRLRAKEEAATNRNQAAPPLKSVPSGKVGDTHRSHQKPTVLFRLTRKNLRLLNRVTRPSSRPSSKTTSTSSTSSTSPSGFTALAFENGVLNPANSKPPTNLADLRARINRSSGTASPPESAYRAYAHAVQTAPNEDSMVHITSKLLKDFDDDLQYAKMYNQGFNSFLQTLDSTTPSLAVLLCSSTIPTPMTLPHLAGEWKGRGKALDEARSQAAYNGAALVYGRNQALDYIGTADPPGYAAVSTFTMDGTTLNIFSHYSAPSEEEEGKTDYHQYPTASTNLCNSFDDFKRGRMQLRNLQENAKDESYALRDRLVGHWKQRQASSRANDASGSVAKRRKLSASAQPTAKDGQD